MTAPTTTGLYLLDGAATRTLLRQRYASRQWWTFLIAEGDGAAFVGRLERAHFRGRRNKDFELLLLPASWGMAGIALAKKKRLPLKRLLRWLDEEGMPSTAEELAKSGRDVIALAPDQAIGARLSLFLGELLRE